MVVFGSAGSFWFDPDQRSTTVKRRSSSAGAGIQSVVEQLRRAHPHLGG
jgi:hypothetical protein